MKKTFLLLIYFFSVNSVFAQLIPIDEGSTVTFKIKNFGFEVNGTLQGLKGSINFDPKNLNAGNINVSIDANSINTNNHLRDSHLKDVDYFDVKTHPTISFNSDKIISKNSAYQAQGKLRIKGISKDQIIPFTILKIENGYVFKSQFKIKRNDFGIGGTSTISNELEVYLHIVSVKNQ